MSETNARDLIGRLSGGRKLIAVVHADMVGYSRLIGLDDVGTLERLRSLRRTLIDPAIAEHGGRIVSSGGDSLLMVFDSVDGAVRCAVKVQQQVPAHDGDNSPDRAIRFRVGINVGDVIPEGTDVHGDVVNVAARLQAECPPSGIYVSRAVRDHVQDRLDLAFEELGALRLKNISRPVEAFALRLDIATVPIAIGRSLAKKTLEALPLPNKPSIAVLAFTNMSGDLEQEYFSDGVAEDIITELSRSHSLFVIARNSSFTYKGLSVHVKQIARELGVRYVVEGSVRRSGGRVRVTAQLIDAETANHIWAERYDRDVNEVFAVQDEISAAVACAILPAVSGVEQQRALRKAPENLDAWEAHQRGLWHMWTRNPPELDRAKHLFQRAVALDVAFAPAYSSLATACFLEVAHHATMPVEQAAQLATDWARRATEIDPNDADSQATLAWAVSMSGINDECRERASIALAINPNSPWANRVQGTILVFGGRPSEGRDALLAAIRLNPRHPANAIPMSQIAVSYYFERDYENALETAKRAIARYPEHPLAYRHMAASLAQLGRVAEARKVIEQAMAVSASSFNFHTRSRAPWYSPDDHEHLMDGLRKAGWKCE